MRNTVCKNVFLRNKETNVVSEKGWNKGESNACCLDRNFFHFLCFIKPAFLKGRESKIAC